MTASRKMSSLSLYLCVCVKAYTIPGHFIPINSLDFSQNKVHSALQEIDLDLVKNNSANRTIVDNNLRKLGQSNINGNSYE